MLKANIDATAVSAIFLAVLARKTCIAMEMSYSAIYTFSHIVLIVGTALVRCVDMSMLHDLFLHQMTCRRLNAQS